MTEELITFETAKLAKEKGFDTSYEFYDLKGNIEPWGMVGGYDKCHEAQYCAPTQSLLQRWLREEHSIHVMCLINGFIGKNKKIAYSYTLCKDDRMHEYSNLNFINNNVKFSIYEEALEEGLYQALKLI